MPQGVARIYSRQNFDYEVPMDVIGSLGASAKPPSAATATVSARQAKVRPDGRVWIDGPFELGLHHGLPVDLSKRGFDHLAINIICPQVEQRDDEIVCRVETASGFSREATFEKVRRSHDFLVPLNEFFSGQLSVTMFAKQDGRPAASPPVIVTISLCKLDKLYSAIAANSVFVFSTARSGSTWLSTDILCGLDDGRCLDEPGIGMLFAPIRWDAERYFNLAGTDCYSVSGFDYEIGQRLRRGAPPVFERFTRSLSGPAGIFNPAYRSHLLRMIRTALIEHAIDVWGLRNYRRLIFKMPNESHAADFLLMALPEARAIHLVRDGRDVLSSRFGAFGSARLATTEDPELRRHAIAFYSHFWNFQNDIIADAARRHDPTRSLSVRFEDLRSDLPGQIGRLFRWLGHELGTGEIVKLCQRADISALPPEQVGYGKPRGDGAVGRFKSIFSAEEISLMTRIMEPNLIRYGYAL